jgi:hypothetical protein
MRKNDQELREASIHLCYEWWMFDRCVNLLATGQYQQTDHVLFNALLTSFTIHSRNLLDFLYPPHSSRSGDMIAVDYFDDPLDWEKVRPQITTTLGSVDISP